MRNFTLFFSIFFGAAVGISYAQTTYVLDPNGAGGFEGGSTWGASGWSVANDGQTNTWNLGTKATGYTGSRAAFISKNSGSTWEYDITAGTKVYLYRDVAVPNVSYSVYLSFSWTGEGESGWDDLEVYKTDTGNTPTGGTSLYNPKTKLGGPYGEVSSWQNVTIDISSYKNSTIRLVFAWKCGTTQGVQPPHALDNVAVYYTIPLSNEDLVSLNGMYNDKIDATEISWAVNANNKIKTFSVERSKDGSSWQEITSISASEGVTNYSIQDQNPLYGKAYYRIKQVENSGFYFYSNPVVVKKALKGDFFLEGIYPNPVNNKLNLSLEINKETPVTVKIINLLGEIVYSENVSATKNFKINTESFNSGIYLLVISSESETQTERIIIQH